MTKESNRLRELFDRAIQLPTEAERSAFIEEICGDHPELKIKLENLLEAYFEAGSFLETAPEVTHAISPPRGNTASEQGDQETRANGKSDGDHLGDYLLKKKIGEGGYGVVYAAEQLRPVRRDVAIKLIKPGMDSKEVISRFNLERQALAVMEHPTIATILDAGTADTGSPYFVMELVDGISITQYCDRYRLTLRQRLELFILVCNGVQHAHQKGVIHRDLKPGNILVTEQDSKPLPKIIDFGIAKAVDHMQSFKTQETGRWQLVGTPIYMSPEQAASKNKLIDARSDIYSLGVVLYELLTGETPISNGELSDLSFTEFLQKIKTGDTPKPSSQLSSSNTNLEEVAKKRQVTPRRLKKLVVGDLDWIVAKALARDIDQRYGSAGAFARDIERFIENEPIEAGPPSATYRLKKFVRKHWISFATSAAFLIVLISTTTFSVIQAMNATHNAKIAKAALDAESDALLAEEERRRQFEEAYRFMIATNRTNRSEGVKTSLSLRDFFGLRKDAVLAAFNDDPEIKVDMIVMVADGYNYFGLAEEGQSLLLDALQICKEKLSPLDPKTLSVKCSLLYSNLARHQDQEVIRLANEILETEQLLDDDSLYFVQLRLGQAHYNLRQYTEAIGALRKALSIATQIAPQNLYRSVTCKTLLALSRLKQGKNHEAIESFEEITRIVENADKNQFESCYRPFNDAVLTFNRFGHDQKAREMIATTLKLAERHFGKPHPAYIDCLVAMTDIDTLQKRHRDAFEKRKQIMELCLGLASPDYLTAVTQKCKIGVLYSMWGDVERGVQTLDEANTMAKVFIGSANKVSIDTEYTFANVLRNHGQRERALPIAMSALSSAKAHLPENHELTRECMDLVAKICLTTKRFAQAAKHFEELMESLQIVEGPHAPHTLDAAYSLVNAYCQNGQQGKGRELAMKFYELTQKHYGAHDRITWRFAYSLAYTHAQCGEPDVAIQLFEEALRNQKQLLPNYDRDIQQTYLQLLQWYEKTNRFEKARDCARESLELAKNNWGISEIRTIKVAEKLAKLEQQLGNDDAAKTLRSEIERWKSNGEEQTGDSNSIASMRIDEERFAEAEKLYDESFAEMRKAAGNRLDRLIEPMAVAGNKFRKAGRQREAHKYFEQAREICESVLPESMLLVNLSIDSGYALYRYTKTTQTSDTERDEAYRKMESRLLFGYEAVNTRFQSVPLSGMVMSRPNLKMVISNMYADWGKPELAKEWKEKD